MKYTNIFPDLDSFRLYADGLQADTTIRQLYPSIRSAAMEMEKVITKAAFTAIMEGEDEDAQELLKTALASGTLYRYQIFASVKRNGSDAALYKYQHEELKESYVENYWKAMDELLDYLDGHADIGGWRESPGYADRQDLPVRDAEEFNRYFGINRSSFFYQKALYIIRDVWKTLKNRIRGFEDDPSVMEAACKALCYRTVAKVVKTFDLSEFPRSIRFDFNHEYTRSSSPRDRDALYISLTAEAEMAEAEIDALQRYSSDADAEGNTNEESNKYYATL